MADGSFAPPPPSPPPPPPPLPLRKHQRFFFPYQKENKMQMSYLLKITSFLAHKKQAISTFTRDLTIRDNLDKIFEVNDEFRFDSNYSFPCSAPTAFRSKQGNLYTLETLVYYIKNHHAKYTDYLQNACVHGVLAVTFIDWKPLLPHQQGLHLELHQI